MGGKGAWPIFCPFGLTRLYRHQSWNHATLYSAVQKANGQKDNSYNALYSYEIYTAKKVRQVG